MALPVFDINNFDSKKSMYIEASAGTGKTYTIQQIVARILKEGTPLSKLLIVTFTDKAAGELRERIRRKLSEVLEEKNLTESQKKIFSEALEQIDNASIHTIHSFCRKTLEEFAFESQNSFTCDMTDDSMLDDAISYFIRDVWPLNKDYEYLLRKGNSNAEVLSASVKSFVKLYRGCDDKGNHLVRIEPLSDELRINECISVKKDCAKHIAENDTDECSLNNLCRIPAVNESLQVLNRHSNETFTSRRNKTGMDIEIRVSDFIDAISSWEKSTLFPNRTYGDYLVSCGSEELEKALNLFYSIRSNASSLLGNVADAYYGFLSKEFILSQVGDVYKYVSDYKRRNSLLTFDDMILNVYNAVNMKPEKDNEFCRKLRDKYSVAIIDEFQDTNFLQWGIFRKVFLGAKGHSIFVVGDPKQSIYSFQEADISVYLDAVKTDIQSGSSLGTNYRSTEQMIKACNALFSCKNYFGGDTEISFTDSAFPKDEKLQTKVPLLNGKEIKPVFISEEDVDSKKYSELVVSRIIEWCRWSSGESALRIYDKNNKDYRNVSFRDFCILARSRFDMEDIEDSMKKAGIPFRRYKDKNLFNGRECAHWISILRAIDADNFFSVNRSILNEALISDFFRVDISSVDAERFDSGTDPVVQMISGWRKLAAERKYSQMLEKIYEDSGIEDYLTDLSRLQNLAKVHQIGNYAVDYLYGNSSNIGDLVAHLESLASGSTDASDEDGNIVARDTDFDAVTLMTIHASKGLEFPVVISVSESKIIGAKSPCIYHGDDGVEIGHSDYALSKRNLELMDENKRLFYVCFTRASNILMIPRFPRPSKSSSTYLGYLLDSLNSFVACADNAKFFDVMKNDDVDLFAQRKIVQSEILPYIKNEIAQDSVTKDQQLKEIRDLGKRMKGLRIYQHSYSSLSGKNEGVIYTEENENPDKEGSVPNEENRRNIYGIDSNPLVFESAELAEHSNRYGEADANYPRGSELGNALHSVFEKTDFSSIKKFSSSEELSQDDEFRRCLEKEFSERLLGIKDNMEQWTRITAAYVYNTLTAKFNLDGSGFSLCDLQEGEKKNEMQFNYTGNSESVHGEGLDGKPLESVFKGFIDLLFVRRNSDGRAVYYIADWKSDVLEEYGNDETRNKVDSDYCVQRVIYSYCLVKWLKQFYPELSDEEIFSEHFGGIFYVFVRGTVSGKGNGIYGQSWNSFGELEAAYKKVKLLMYK